ncbi:alginate lyase family protein [Sorangium sp. So ce1036]|uniref:heparinase II/III domain-containing protein n=1 Tax=Sorangium sp. So ce1036 TaxID=3133328 RepID=UPI003F0178EB
MSLPDRAARLARTVRSLHPLQVLARPASAALTRVVRRVPCAGAPAIRAAFPPADPRLRAFAARDRERASARLARLPPGSMLRAYEAAYGFEALGEAAPLSRALLAASGVALAPYPSSVRARQLALAARLGARGAGGELARACRAILVHPELHLLGNHLLENGLGLACGGAVAKGLEADAWWRAGSALLAWQLPEQFLADGGHFEGSASYHLWLLAGLLEAIELADASGRGAPALWRETARAALAWASAVRAPDGAYPLFNDAALDAAPALDDVLSLGEACGLPVHRGAPAAAAEPGAALLDPTGWALLSVPGAWLAFDAGPDGAPYQPGHAHADALGFELWIDGVRTVVDYGVESYGEPAARAATRATRAHSTVEIDDTDSCEVWGGFRVGRRARARLLALGADAGGARAEASHDGYAWMPGGPAHRRRVELRPRRLEITDTVTGPFRRAVSRLRLDAGAAARVRVTADGAPAPPSPGRWYPRHGDPLPAVVLAREIPRGGVLRWVLDW